MNLTKRKIQSVIDKDGYVEIKGATVLVNKDGHAAIVNKGGAFYWVDNKALVFEFSAATSNEGAGLIDKHLDEFEAWVSIHGMSCSKDNELYRSHIVGWMWQAWKASRGLC